MQLIRASHTAETATRRPTATFTGTVLTTPMFTASDCMGNSVTFLPGARTFWHTHERGQILIVTGGSGLVCSRGERPRRLRVGDTVHVPAGEMHWHGGACDALMAHTAFSLGKTTWHEEVAEDEYNKAHETAD